MNKVTIAIASCNNANYIERCIESAINQTYKDLDILIIDDGSKDDTINKCKPLLSDKRVRIIQKENGGLSSVRQRSLEEAIGTYICFIDADDYLTETHVEKMLEKMLADQSDICVCSTRFEDANGHYIEKNSKTMRCEDSMEPLQIEKDSITKQYAKIAKMVHLSDSWNKMYSISFLRKSGVAFNMPKGLNGSDTLFNRKLSLHLPKYSTISNEGYIHVIYKSSAVHRKNKDLQRSYMFITEELIYESKKLNIDTQCEHMLCRYYYGTLFRAFFDAYKDSSGNVQGFFRPMLKKHDAFVKEQNFPRPTVSLSRLQSRKVFFFLLRRARWLLPTYFFIMNHLKQ